MWPFLSLLGELRGFRFDPDEVGGAAGGTAAASGGAAGQPGGGDPAAAAGGGPAAGGAPAAGTGDSGGGSGPAGGHAGGAAAAGQGGGAGVGGGAGGGGAPFDFFNFAREQGLDLSAYGDPRAAATALLQRVRQNDAYARYGQELAPHYSEITAWLASRGQQQGQAPAQAPAHPFGLPQYDPSWREMVTTDAQGNLIPKPGAPMDVVMKLQGYAHNLRQVQERFWNDPAALLKPVIEQLVGPMLTSHTQAELGRVQDNQFAEAFIRDNTQWLHRRDQGGNVMRDPFTQAPMLTPEGQRFLQHLQTAEQWGINGLANQQQFAMQQLRAEIAVARGGQAAGGQQQQQPTAQQQANQSWLSQFNRRPSQSGSTAPFPNPQQTVAQNGGQDLRARLEQALAGAGVTDADLMGG